MDIEKVKKAFDENSPSALLTDDEMGVLISLLTNSNPNLNKDVDELDKESKDYEDFKPLVESFTAKIFMGRIKSMTSLRISLGTLIALLYYMESPGDCVMYAYYMHIKLLANTFVDLSVFTMELFPMGMFSKKQFQNIWTAQKVTKDDLLQGDTTGSPDNLLDYSITWKK